MQDFKVKQEENSTNTPSNSSGRQMEEQHLAQCVKVIQDNIDDYTSSLKEITAETKELYDNYRSNNPELHNDLVIGLDMKSQMERILAKNLLALKKPYFGRIDYKDHGENSSYTLYLGKNGVRKNAKSVIVDWRAPISSVYYDSDIGDSSYRTPAGEYIDITLNLKRTYEINDSRLIDYYDSDVITNDEFLTKYLSKNKEVVLGEIIATIQKEQNEIIRDTPFHSVIVQGVAGSGKTTVAMHRISYILYNYKEKFRPDEFYIIGSNKMLLNYITGVLPNLDVYNINQMTMEEFFLLLLDKDFDLKKGKYTLSNSFLKVQPAGQNMEAAKLKGFKGSIYFMKALEHYLTQYELETIKTDPVIYRGKVVYSKEDIIYLLTFFKEKPLQEKIEMLNKRLTYKIASINEEEDQKKEVIRSEVNRFKGYFGKRNAKINLMEVYKGFLLDLISNGQEYREKDITIPEAGILSLLIKELQEKKIDLYDLGMLSFIKSRLKDTKDFEYVSHIVIDEAQDFGANVFYIFKQLFKTCTYTIMGDVSQNIYYDTGMNDWEVLKREVFLPAKDKFYVLAKSYRNTVEISEYAGKVLKKCSFKTYDIEPIIRHGKEVVVTRTEDEADLVRQTVKTIQDIQGKGYDTIAVICRSVEETVSVYEKLNQHLTIEQLKEDMEEMKFSNGVMVLPIHMTKGLEFDAVILWNPDEENYRASDADAKLLYVAVTRALHELSVIYHGKLSKLLTD
ncbi:MAG: ATP-dependent helicase rep [Herbinix sp.]|jgi:DNA helicase-2/ATP-dependent DNA helicase PcrA|nr:ATP-dependent helicase rep [Herbinix sp.]